VVFQFIEYRHPLYARCRALYSEKARQLHEARRLTIIDETKPLHVLTQEPGVPVNERNGDFSPTDKRNEQVWYAGKKRGPDSEIESSRSLNRS